MTLKFFCLLVVGVYPAHAQQSILATPAQFDSCLIACQSAADAAALVACTKLVNMDQLDLTQLGSDWAQENVSLKCGDTPREGATLGEVRASRISALCDANGAQKIRVVLKGAQSVCEDHWDEIAKKRRTKPAVSPSNTRNASRRRAL